ncbi:MAG: response regulator [Bdellovibrionota bacterium]
MRTKDILIIEDEDIVAEDIAEILESAGYPLAGRADNGKDAIELVKETKPSLILMDIKIKGGIDGITTAEKIKEFSDVPIIFLTAFADRTTLDRAKLTEPQAYLVKPYKEIDLLTTIELALFRRALETKALQRSDNLSPVLNPSTLNKVMSPKGSENYDEILKVLSVGQYLSLLPADQLEKLAEYCELKKHPESQYIVFEGKSKINSFLVSKGRIAVVKASGSGKELIVELMPPGDGFGLISSLSKQPYPYSLRSQIDSELIWMPKEILLGLLEDFPEINRKIMEDVFTRLRNSHDISRALAHDRVELRIISAITALIPKFSAVSQHLPEIYMTRQELADLVGTSQETCIRITKSMERDGILDLTQSGRIAVKNTQALSDMIMDSL